MIFTVKLILYIIGAILTIGGSFFLILYAHRQNEKIDADFVKFIGWIIFILGAIIIGVIYKCPP